MARPFTNQEARDLIQRHRNLIRQMEEELAIYDRNRSELRNTVASALEAQAERVVDDEPIESVCSRRAGAEASVIRQSGCETVGQLKVYPAPPANMLSQRRSLIEQVKPLVRVKLWHGGVPSLAGKLILETYQVIEATPHKDVCNEQLSFYRDHIQNAIRDLEPYIGTFKWFFLSRETKDLAINAFEYLRNTMDGQYGTQSEYAIEHLHNAWVITSNAAYQAFNRHQSSFYELLDEIAPGKAGETSPIDDLSMPFSTKKALSLAKELGNLGEEIKARANDDTVTKLRDKVCEAANALAVQEAIKSLEQIPIEEINRDKKGIRVAALKDAGYYSLAHLSKATPYSLQSIRGISYDQASTILRTYRELSHQVLRGAKIRLSTDSKTTEATDLVKVVYQYMRAIKLQEELAKYLGSARSISMAASDLRWCAGKIGWMNATSNEHDKAKDAYQYLSELDSGGFKTEVKRILSALRGGNAVVSFAAWDDFSKQPVAYFNVLEELVPDLLGGGGLYGLPEDLAREIQEQSFFPDGLLCTLRRYQEWGVKYALHQERVLLGDEMGLGKTVQAIATIVSLRNTGETHFVVVCPASVLSNWCREISKMSRLRVIKVHGADRKKALGGWRRMGGVAVTTYETTPHFELPDGFKVGLVVVDEAHYIKNPNTKRTMNVKRLCGYTNRLLFMTGTALENKVDEMVSLINILQPRIAAKVRGMQSLSGAPIFRETVAPVYFRRKREDVLTELPDKEESQEWCTLGRVEREDYERAVLSRNFAKSRRVSWLSDDLKNSAKAQRLRELVEEAKGEGRKVLVFSFFLDTIDKVAKLFGEDCLQPINGSVPPQRRQEIIDEFDEAPAGTVLVAQIQSGGTGLNIQTASVVVICEPQLKPSIENQAISRAYRMGQTRKVLVYRLLCEDTIDERITNLLEEKQRVFDAFADKSVAAQESIELDKTATDNLIEEEIERINKRKAEGK